MMTLVGIGLAFLVIIVLVTRKVALGYALLTGSFIVAMFSGQSLGEYLLVVFQSVIHPTTLTLVATLALIGILGNLMKQLGILEKMVDALQTVLRSSKLTIMAIPSLLGTLLVTGGAIMAAPMVDTLGDRLELSQGRRAAINMLFRHGWYFVFPFMPTFILMKEVANININQLILLQMPLTVVIIWAGYRVYISDAVDDTSGLAKPEKSDYLELARYTSPIWSSLLLALLVGIPFHLALLVGISLTVLLGRPPVAKLPRMLWRSISVPVLMSGVGIMVFKDVLGQGDALAQLTETLMSAGLPLELIVIALPMAVGLVSASNTSAVGITLPLLLPVIQQSEHLLLYSAAIYGAAFIGYFISPVHLCQVLTLEYFRVKMNELYRAYLIPIGATALTLIALLVVGRWF